MAGSSLFRCIRPKPVQQPQELTAEDRIRRPIPSFPFRETAIALNNFRTQNLIGKGRYGGVYRGKLRRGGQIIAAKVLNEYCQLAETEFGEKVRLLARLRHPNLVKLIGYCGQGDQRIIVYEFMPLGSLDYFLHSRVEVMPWDTRVKIAADISKGLNFLHNQIEPSVMYRDFKASNVLLGDGFHAKLSDLGHGLGYDETPSTCASTDAASRKRRYGEKKGYCAPEYAATGTYTLKSEVYCFGVLLLELFSGTRPSDMLEGDGKQHLLINWGRLLSRTPFDLVKVADLRLVRDFSVTSCVKAFRLTLKCLEDDPDSRPNMFYVMNAFDRLIKEEEQTSGSPVFEVGQTSLSRAEEGQASCSRVFEVGQTSNSRQAEEGQASCSRVFEVGQTSNSRQAEEGQASCSRVFEVGQTSNSPLLEEEEEEEEEEKETEQLRRRGEARQRTQNVVNGESTSNTNEETKQQLQRSLSGPRQRRKSLVETKLLRRRSF